MREVMPRTAARSPSDGHRRVLHVLPSMTFGGGALAAAELANAMAETSGLDVRLCVLAERPAKEPSWAKPLGIKYLDLPSPARRSANLIRCVRGLRHYLAELSPDIVHSHLLPADLVAACATMACRARHFAHLRDTREWLYSDRPQDRVRLLLYKTAFRFAGTHFVAVSNDAADYNQKAFGVVPDRMHVVIDGIDFARLKASPPAASAAFHVGCAGRFVAEKGHAYVIEALAQSVRAGHDVKLTLAGSGRLEAHLKHLAEEQRVADRVTILQDVDDMGAFYSSLDAFILPSLATEGLPRVVMEAMALARPVIATRTTGMSDIIEPDAHGILVDPSNAGQIAEAIDRLIRDVAFCRQIGEAGARRVLSQFQIARVAREVAALYDRTA